MADLLLYHLGHIIEQLPQSWAIRMREDKLESDDTVSWNMNTSVNRVSMLFHEINKQKHSQ